MERYHMIWLSVLLLAGIAFADDDFSEKGCNNPADIVFVLDESGSIWGPHFTDQLNFVQDIIDHFDVRPNKTHFGVMTFATEPRVIFHLNQYHTHDSLKDNIKVIEQKRGETYTDKALRLVREEMFAPQYSRSWVPHVVIFITDGESNYPEDTAKAAALAQKDGLQIFAVGVGPFVNKDELLTIAGKPDQVYQVDSYTILQTLRDMLAWQTCQVTTLPPTTTPAPPQMIEGCNGAQKMDNIWAVSDSATSRENNLALMFVVDVTYHMRLSPLKVQVGLTPRFCQNSAEVLLREHDTGSGFMLALHADRRYASDANTHQHIKYIREKGMTEESGAREDSIKYGILIVDSPFGDNFGKAKKEARKAAEEGIKLLVIGVGSRVDEAELKEIAATSDDVIMVDDYENLSKIESELLARLCAGLNLQRPDHFRYNGRPAAEKENL